MAFCVDDEVVDGGNPSVFHDGIQGATGNGDLFKLEIGVAFLEVEVFDVAVGCGGHLVQEKRMSVKVIVLARCDEVQGAVMVAYRDV